MKASGDKSVAAEEQEESEYQRDQKGPEERLKKIASPLPDLTRQEEEKGLRDSQGKEGGQQGVGQKGLTEGGVVTIGHSPGENGPHKEGDERGKNLTQREGKDLLSPGGSSHAPNAKSFSPLAERLRTPV